MNLRLATPIVSVLAAVCVFAASAISQSNKDPIRPSCTSARCRRFESFVKAHYCGESPFGNGPDNGCEIKRPKTPQPSVQVLANYHCDYDEEKGTRHCEQKGQPTPGIHNVLIDEMRRIGLPANANGETYYIVWKSAKSGLSLAEADYSQLSGADVALCEVIVAIDSESRVTVVRKVPFKKTDADKPDVIEWTPIDLADVAGDGQEDLILEADAYENHWIEVVTLSTGSPKTIFSGLGYYL